MTTSTTSNQPDFLQPGFDPGKCTVPRLRGILLEWEIDFKSSARKGELVELYKEHVAPAIELMRRQRRVDTRRIEDPIESDEDPAERIVPPIRRSSPRKSVRTAVQSESRGRPSQVNTERVKKKEVFSDYNPFQTPPAGVTVSRRKTFGTAIDQGNKEEVIQQKRHIENESETEFEPEPELPTGFSMQRRKQSHTTRNAFFLVLVSILALGVYLWRSASIAAGYCGVEETTERVYGVLAKCKECPTHAKCFPGLRAECDPGFVRVDDLRSLIGVARPGCVPDRETGRRVAAVADEAVRILREARAVSGCGAVKTAAVAEDAIEAILMRRKASTVSDQQLSALWKEAFQFVCGRPEVTVRRQDGQVFLESSSRAYISLRCLFKQMLRACVVPAGAAVLLAVVGAGIWRCSAQRRLENGRVRMLVRDVYARLAQKRRDGTQTGAISVAQLRDAVLAEMDIKQRRRLWQAVQQIVEDNANVRARQVELRGEITRVWEWVGD
ncbi:Inner nuclear membrane protein SRC1 [Neolecta irregularis DAH-3]|uniref:Inner nuclear membrane protein SRC1 n=1 Tax=Neolecta irregularis (strain DAH-3) TaxID=1198029 RepID=A0A1U7LV88_NEOID|nr:Inner nuclear membrane protein SRC1 [Neolecta irregularis DAH-3]|eukprot:OLL26462.1 Inner nuclear membrane protein SRC1 [Neolecta irregularis DAH-3]